MHPDDIEIDPHTLDVRLHHLPTAEQRHARAELIEARDALLAQLAQPAAILTVTAEDEALAFLQLQVMREQLERLNQALPPRLRLTSRSAATRSGEPTEPRTLLPPEFEPG